MTAPFVWLALLGALAIGLSLGLLGSGGSILTVPILVYVLGQPEKVAIAGSLLIVGAIALIGAIPSALRGQVDGRSVLLFGGPGMLGSYLGAALASFLPGPLQLAIFALVMLAAAATMLRAPQAPAAVSLRNRYRLAGDGVLVGILTGLVGVGGGFLIVPALVLLGGLSMHRAIGTSLFIISVNAFSGFATHYWALRAAGTTLDWQLIGIFIAVGAVGSLVGQQIGGRIPQWMLRRGFATILLLMSVYILWRSVPELLTAWH